MATLPVDSAALRPPAVTRDRGFLFVAYALVCFAIAIGGFVPSFWLPAARLGFGGTWLVIFHGVMFSAWSALFLSQTVLVERGRVIDHRAWGLVGISLASMLLLLGFATAVASLEARLAAGFADRARAFTIVPITSVMLFFGFFAAAIANIPRPDWHKRLMMVATGAALVPAFARIFFVLLDGRAIGATAATSPPGTPEMALRPSAAVLVLLLVTAIADGRRRGKLHPAWLWGMGIFAAACVARVPLSRTPAWYAVTDWLTAFS
jgi:hypothetical protein